jgi:hypothetical protein
MSEIVKKVLKKPSYELGVLHDGFFPGLTELTSLRVSPVDDTLKKKTAGFLNELMIPAVSIRPLNFSTTINFLEVSIHSDVLSGRKVYPQMDGLGLVGHLMENHISSVRSNSNLFCPAFIGFPMRSGFGEDYTVD